MKIPFFETFNTVSSDKQNVREIYTTTLTYRYVDEEEQANEVDANSQE